MIEFETQRLIIRDHQIHDLEAHHRLMSDIHIMDYIQDIMTHSLEESKNNLMFSIQESSRQDRQCYFFAMTLKDGTLIGSIGYTLLGRNDQGANAELGYFILKEYWGKGYTCEAANAVIDFAFNHGIHKITTGCIQENQASERIMRKLGMVKEAHLRKHVLHNGLWKDRVEYGLLKEEWRP